METWGPMQTRQASIEHSAKRAAEQWQARTSIRRCVCASFLQTVWVKSNYQGHGINIPAVWQVMAEPFQSVGPPHPDKGRRWRRIDAERRSRRGVLANTRPFLRNSWLLLLGYNRLSVSFDYMEARGESCSFPVKTRCTRRGGILAMASQIPWQK